MPTRKLKDWIGTYLEYTQGHESPLVFHQWTGLSVLSAAIRRNLWIDRGFYTLYPNLYTVLVASSGRLRKSVATGIGCALLRKVPGVQLIHEKITVEALIGSLNRQTNGVPDGTSFIYAPELTVFIGGDDPNAKKLIAFLVSIHEGKDEWEYTTIGRGKEQIFNVLLTLLGATTPDLLRTLPTDAVGGGFLGRVVFIGADRRRHAVAWPRITDKERLLAKDLIHDLIHISLLKGPFVIPKETEQAFEKWYMKIPEPHDPRLCGFVERMHDQVLRVAMVLSAGLHDELIVHPQELHHAIKLIEGVLAYLPEILSIVGTTEHSQDAIRVLRQLERAGGELKHSQLLALNGWKLSAEDFRKVIQTLVERKEIEVNQVGRGEVYKLLKVKVA